MCTQLTSRRVASISSLACLAFLTFAASATPASAIVRRHDVDDAQYRLADGAYPACLDIIERGDGIGTLISPRWLLTAAHVAEVLVEEGRQQIPGPNGPLAVSRIVLHPQYRDDTDDMALIQLAEPLVGVEPIGLYGGNDEVGKEVIFVGRGDTGTGQTGETASDRVLRSATNIIVGADQHWVRFDFDAPGDAGVTPLEGISGSGDSGGPAFIRRGDTLLLAGISAYQDEGDHRLGQYGVEEFYGRVSRYLPWIEEITGLRAGPEGSREQPEGEDPEGNGEVEEPETEERPENGTGEDAEEPEGDDGQGGVGEAGDPEDDQGDGGEEGEGEAGDEAGGEPGETAAQPTGGTPSVEGDAPQMGPSEPSVDDPGMGGALAADMSELAVESDDDRGCDATAGSTTSGLLAWLLMPMLYMGRRRRHRHRRR